MKNNAPHTKIHLFGSFVKLGASCLETDSDTISTFSFCQASSIHHQQHRSARVKIIERKPFCLHTDDFIVHINNIIHTSPLMLMLKD